MYRAAVDAQNTVWTNICALMRNQNPTIDAVQRRTGVGRGTIQRIKEGDVATRISSLSTIAAAFGLEVWQLLVPGLHPDKLPKLAGDALNEDALADKIAARLAAPTYGKPNDRAA